MILKCFQAVVLKLPLCSSDGLDCGDRLTNLNRNLGAGLLNCGFHRGLLLLLKSLVSENCAEYTPKLDIPSTTNNRRRVDGSYRLLTSQSLRPQEEKNRNPHETLRCREALFLHKVECGLQSCRVTQFLGMMLKELILAGRF